MSDAVGDAIEKRTQHFVRLAQRNGVTKVIRYLCAVIADLRAEQAKRGVKA